MSEETTRILRLRNLLAVPEGAASFFDDAEFYSADLPRPYDTVLARLYFLEPKLKTLGFYLHELSSSPTHHVFLVDKPSQGQIIHLGNLVVHTVDDHTAIDGIESGGRDPLYNSPWFKVFWHNLTAYIQPPPYDEVIKTWHRARGQNPKITLKEICERLGANYDSVNAAASRARRRKRKT